MKKNRKIVSLKWYYNKSSNIPYTHQASFFLHSIIPSSLFDRLIVSIDSCPCTLYCCVIIIMILVLGYPSSKKKKKKKNNKSDRGLGVLIFVLVWLHFFIFFFARLLYPFYRVFIFSYIIHDRGSGFRRERGDEIEKKKKKNCPKKYK